MKRKWSASVGYWVNYLTLPFDLTHELVLEYFKVKFWNMSILGIVGLIHGKLKGSKSIGYWTKCVTFPF